METELEDLESHAEIERHELAEKDIRTQIDDLKEYFEIIENRLKCLEKRPKKIEISEEEIDKFLTPRTPNTSSNTYAPDFPDLNPQTWNDFKAPEMSEEDVEVEVRKRLEEWRLTLSEEDRKIVCGDNNHEENGSEVCNEQTEHNKSDNTKIEEKENKMDVEFELSAEMVSTPKTDVKPRRKALLSEKSPRQSVKRSRRSAKF